MAGSHRSWAWLAALTVGGGAFAGEADEVERLLLVPPLVGRPTETSVTLNLVAATEDVRCTVAVTPKPESEPPAIELEPGRGAFVEIRGLEPGTRYRYTVRAEAGETVQEAAGGFSTAAPAGRPFRFALFSDTHLPVADPRWFEGPRFAADRHYFQGLYGDVSRVMRRAVESMAAEEPEFAVCLGDMLHQPFGFNETYPHPGVVRLGYLDLRRHLDPLGSRAPFFGVVGNWEGENGWHAEEDREAARSARKELLCNPGPDTTRFGGSDDEDYYAWEWGDAFFCVLNCMGYTRTRHTMHPDDDGTADDWTLGEEQLAWFERTLRATTKPYKFVLVHHVVGGRAGDEANSAYGRGGGRAARVGEQERVHELMLEAGVQVFFYGHDHVFTDMVVEGIHYTLPGSAGAPWKFTAEETGYEEWDERSGFALVDVDAERARVEFRSLAGKLFESFEVAPAADED